MIKKLLFTTFLFFSLGSFAQFNNPDGSGTLRHRRPQNTKTLDFPEFNVAKSIGLTIYNLEKLSKKIGLKKPNQNYDKVISILKTFNKSNIDLKRINSFIFSEAKSTIEVAQKKVKESKNYAPLQKAYKEVASSLTKVIEEVEEKEKHLDSSLENLLSKKQFKKWKKYKVKVKKRRK